MMGWKRGETHAITWRDIKGATVKIEVSVNNGVTWSTITGAAAIINDIDADPNSWNWVVDAPATTQALIRVTSNDDASYTDVSDAVFTILNNSAITSASISVGGGIGLNI
jgi:hypothetical protein